MALDDAGGLRCHWCCEHYTALTSRKALQDLVLPSHRDKVDGWRESALPPPMVAGSGAGAGATLPCRLWDLFTALHPTSCTVQLLYFPESLCLPMSTSLPTHMMTITAPFNACQQYAGASHATLDDHHPVLQMRKLRHGDVKGKRQGCLCPNLSSFLSLY